LPKLSEKPFLINLNYKYFASQNFKRKVSTHNFISNSKAGVIGQTKLHFAKPRWLPMYGSVFFRYFMNCLESHGGGYPVSGVSGKIQD
jgi:hypothetical protein